MMLEKAGKMFGSTGPVLLTVTKLKWPAVLLQVVSDVTETLTDGTMPETPHPFRRVCTYVVGSVQLDEAIAVHRAARDADSSTAALAHSSSPPWTMPRTTIRNTLPMRANSTATVPWHDKIKDLRRMMLISAWLSPFP